MPKFFKSLFGQVVIALVVGIAHKKLNGDLDKLSRRWLGEPLPALPAL